MQTMSFLRTGLLRNPTLHASIYKRWLKSLQEEEEEQEGEEEESLSFSNLRDHFVFVVHHFVRL